ncbi:MAG: peptide-methionine (S)-S-oxide reductase MsrA [Gammaproteobacteria bacterium]|nr:peptide-methionine (S)-S-oxide reductase MsrA [Gammaproteobacteria bacterium]
MSILLQTKATLPNREDALSGRDQKIPVPDQHYVHGHTLQEPFPDNMQKALFGLGCFWGAEKMFWQLEGVYSTAVGYSSGYTPNPTYQEVCSGMTAHNEVVLVVFDPAIISYQKLLESFWQSHHPTQGMQQGNDCGTQYRSGIYTYNHEQQNLAEVSRSFYQQALSFAGYPQITTEIISASEFYYAEDYHQQYLAKNPNGYCGLGGTGVSYPE